MGGAPDSVVSTSGMVGEPSLYRCVEGEGERDGEVGERGGEGETEGGRGRR